MKRFFAALLLCTQVSGLSLYTVRSASGETRCFAGPRISVAGMVEKGSSDLSAAMTLSALARSESGGLRLSEGSGAAVEAHTPERVPLRYDYRPGLRSFTAAPLLRLDRRREVSRASPLFGLPADMSPVVPFHLNSKK